MLPPRDGAGDRKGGKEERSRRDTGAVAESRALKRTSACRRGAGAICINRHRGGSSKSLKRLL